MSLHDMTLSELLFRQRLINAILRMLRTDAMMRTDPRTPDAIAEYERQMQAVIAETVKRQEKIEPVNVRMQPASLSGKLGG